MTTPASRNPSRLSTGLRKTPVPGILKMLSYDRPGQQIRCQWPKRPPGEWPRANHVYKGPRSLILGASGSDIILGQDFEHTGSGGRDVRGVWSGQRDGWENEALRLPQPPTGAPANRSQTSTRSGPITKGGNETANKAANIAVRSIRSAVAQPESMKTPRASPCKGGSPAIGDWQAVVGFHYRPAPVFCRKAQITVQRSPR
jgi:hypothetical protein